MNDHKKVAAIMVREALANGTLVKAIHCEFCSSPDGIKAFHRDYGKPLMVQWLCGDCRKEWKKQHEFTTCFFRADVPKDAIDLAMKKYFMHFHIETTRTMSTYVGVSIKGN